MDDIENQNSRKRRSWTQGETRAFIHSYAQRKAEFEHPRKKKTAMSNVLEDLVAQGVLGSEATTEMFSNKMKNLKKSFKATKDNNNRTGEAASSAPFEDLMEELFGTRPEINNSHTLFCESARKPTKGLPITPKRNFDEPSPSQPSPPPSPSQPSPSPSPSQPSPSPSPSQPSTSFSSTQPPQQPPTPPMPLSPEELHPTPTPSTSLRPTPSPSIPPPSSTKKRTLKEKYERKLELKEQKNKIYERYLKQKIQKLEEMEDGRLIRLEMKKQFLKEVNDSRNVLPQ